MRNENSCPFCDGAGYILEDKDAYFYYAKERLQDINREKNKAVRDRKLKELKDLHNVPMQPLAVECPKCHGSGVKTQEVVQ